MNDTVQPRKKTRHLSRRLLWLLIGLVVVLVAVRLAMPYEVERYVNRQLNKSKDYSGHIGNIQIQLLRGQYRINAIEIFKRTGEVKAPLFSAKKLELSIEWKELFHGSVVGKVRMFQPHLNIVAGPTDAQAQTGKDENWDSTLESLFPFKLNRFELMDGQVHFQNEHSTPPVDIYLNALSVTATNLTNARDVKTLLPSGVVAHSTTIGGGGLDVRLQLNLLNKFPTYQLDAQLTNVDLTALNDFLKAYGKFDVERGQFALFTSVASTDGNYDGYVKVFFDHMKVFAWEKERQKNALAIFWEAIVGTVTTALKNHVQDSLATRIPISGSYKSTKVGTWTAVGTLLRHAFIRALVPRVDEQETVQKVEEKTGGKDKAPPESPPVKGIEKFTKSGS